VPPAAPAMVELDKNRIDVVGAAGVDVRAGTLEENKEDNMIVLDDGDAGDESKTAALIEEDTVPAGTATIELIAEGPIEDKDISTVLDPPITPPPTLLEVVPAGEALELADIAADEDITGVDEAGGDAAGVEEPAGGGATLELASTGATLELAGGGATFELAGGATALELAGGTIALELAGGGGFELGGETALELAGGMTEELREGASGELVVVGADDGVISTVDWTV
jgi:hypothetical protein